MIFKLIKNIFPRYKRLHNKQYTKGLVAASYAIHKGNQVGILTARGGKGAHREVITKIEKILSANIPNSFQHFTGDDDDQTVDNVALKKLLICIEYRFGFNGRPKFDKVLLHDDSEENINIVKSAVKYLKRLPLSKNNLNEVWKQVVGFRIDGLDAHNIKEWNIEKLKREFRKNKNTLQLFDLDGTVFHSITKIYIINSKGDLLDSLTPDEFNNTTLKEVKKQYGKDAGFDFSEFRDVDMSKITFKN